MDSQENKPLNLSDITRIVSKNNKLFAYNIWVPSLKREIRFEEINTLQQKRLIKSLLDESIYNIEFGETFRDILKENCSDSDVNVDKLDVFDKLVIAIGMRINSISPELELTLQIEEDNKKIPTKVNVDLGDLYNKIQELIDSDKFNSNVISNEKYSFRVTCGIPTVANENYINSELRKQEKNINTEKMANSISNAFIGEIVKYVRNVEILQDGEYNLVSWDKIDFKTKTSIVEMFGVHLLREIIDYINTIKTEFNKIDLFKFTINGKEYEQRLVLDGNFFMIT